jgi:lipoate-protein ligase A
MWRVTSTYNLDGFDNMAIDLDLLEKFIKNNEKPILRFYSWKKPTISLGRNQNETDIKLEYCKKNNISIVKRPTGGKAVFHQGEFTYSFVSSKKYGMPESLFDSYVMISKALILGLKKLKNINVSVGEDETKNYTNSPFCFSSATVSDLNFDGYKIVGSAQLRKGNALLQHGSILINQDFSILPKIFNNNIDINNQKNLIDILNFEPSFEDLEKAILAGFSEFFGVAFERIII